MQTLTKVLFLNISLLEHRTLKPNTQMLGYKGLDSCHEQCVYGLASVVQTVYAREIDDISGKTQIPTFLLAKHTTNHETINLSEIRCNFEARFDSALRCLEFPHDCNGVGKSKEEETISLREQECTTKTHFHFHKSTL